MKNYIKNISFEFNEGSDIHGSLTIICKAKHNALPLVWARKRAFSPNTSKLLKDKHIKNEVIVKLFRLIVDDITETAEKGVSKSYCCNEDPLYPTYIYSGEWDYNRNRWFIKNENGKIIYEN